MQGRKPKPLLTNDPVDLRPPGWMTRRQKLLWREAISNAPAGLLALMDAALLTNWVIACDLHRAACEKSARMGLLVKSPTKGLAMQNPYLPIINRQAEIMMRAGGELGFTPISRSRLTKLDQVTAPKVLQDEPQGKKEQAQVAAVTAQAGTEWADLLPTGPAQ